MRDAIPEPKIISAALKACRHQNDFALAVRFLEAVQVSKTTIKSPVTFLHDVTLSHSNHVFQQLKCGPHKKEVWPWLAQQVKPTLEELGIPTPEEMGYDKPELYLKSVMDM